MAVKFANANSRIAFTPVTNILGLTSKTYSFRVGGNLSSGKVSGFLLATTWYDEITLNLSTGSVGFTARFSTTSGIWSASFTPTGNDHIVITYNGGSTTNNPIIYVNGVSKTVTETGTPAGTYQSPAGAFRFGDLDGITSGLDYFQADDVRHYSNIKTAAQVISIESENLSTDQNIDETGLVFHAPLTMCKGLSYSTFAGSTLSASNEFIDRVNGYLGVPSGSPVGA